MPLLLLLLLFLSLYSFLADHVADEGFASDSNLDSHGGSFDSDEWVQLPDVVIQAVVELLGASPIGRTCIGGS
jgi:hypothetical protein